MIDYSHFYKQLEETSLAPWLDVLPTQVQATLQTSQHGDLPKWFSILDDLPKLNPSTTDLNAGSVRIGEEGDAQTGDQEKLEELLRKFHPWRKGPFNLFGIEIESEWRSDMKWHRLEKALGSLEGRTILDVGSGNGYYLLRMLGAGAKLAIGIDPTLLYVMQFYAFQHYLQDHRAAVLPLGVDEMPQQFDYFDTVFSMGILYHRRQPEEHLQTLMRFLKPGGQLVLETLVIDGDKEEVLIPENRYAQMRNVWSVPSTLALEGWLEKEAYQDIQLIDVTKTTPEEQRVTDWMGFQSLSDFLDPKDSEKTVEGYPAPKRAIFLARKP